MKEALFVKKIVWAINPLEDEQAFYEHAQAALRFFNGTHPVEIHPVYALEASNMGASFEADPAWIGSTAAEELKRAAIGQVTNFLRAHTEWLEIQSSAVLREPTVLPTSSPSQAVDAVIGFAAKIGADLILVNSHGKSGIRRMLQGSFSETLMHRSQVPLLVVGAKSHPSGKLENILFPTDFGEHSKHLFRRALSVAKDFGAKITLLHSIPPIQNTSMDFDFASHLESYHGKVVTSTQLREHDIEHEKRREHAWADYAKHEGVTVETVVEEKNDDIARGILAYLKDHPVSLVMIETHSGAVRAALLGSVAHTLIRKADCPVWVFPIQYVEQSFDRATAA